MKSNKGITLVALVVTIIVLIILAGISINLILDDNGIITIAKQAKENTELAKVEEETELNEAYKQLETEGAASSDNLPYDSITKLTEFKTAIANAIEETGGVKPDTSADATIFANNIKGIVKEVTKNATATESDIAQGKTAWVDGKQITGNATIFNPYVLGGIALKDNALRSAAFSTDESYFTVQCGDQNYFNIEVLKNMKIKIILQAVERGDVASRTIAINNSIVNTITLYNNKGEYEYDVSSGDVIKITQAKGNSVKSVSVLAICLEEL